MSGGIGPVRRNDDPTLDASVAAAAQAAQDAARTAQTLRDGRQPETIRQRALDGFEMASPRAPTGQAYTDVKDDVAANARTALERTDLPENVKAQVTTVLDRIGNGIRDGSIEPRVNSTFQDHIYTLATHDPLSTTDAPAFQGALAQLQRAAEVVDRVQLANGTKLTYDPEARQQGVQRAGLPVLNVENIDADLYFRTQDGVLHIESTKNTTGALANELKESVNPKNTDPANTTQVGRQLNWLQGGTENAPRQLNFYAMDGSDNFRNVLHHANLQQLGAASPNPDVRNIKIGDRAFSLNELKDVDAKVTAAADRYVAAQRQAAGNPADFNVGRAYGEFARNNVTGVEDTLSRFNVDAGERQQPLGRLPSVYERQSVPAPSLRQGAGWGGGAAGGIALVDGIRDGNLSGEDIKNVATSTAVGTGTGVLAAQGEKLVNPVVDRAIGNSVQQRATQSALSHGADDAAAAARGLAARNLTTRVAGSTAVGAVITAGVSAFENREGLVRGDSQAIGNVTADTVVGIGSVAASTAAGAAIGSVVPVAGTAVGAVVGLAVGVGITYGAQISGVRDAIAGGVSNVIDGIKSWF